MRRRITQLLATAVLLVGVSCGAPATQSSAPKSDTTASTKAGTSLSELSARLKGLDAEERRKKLIQLAKAEDATITWYGSINTDIMEPIADKFEDTTGIPIAIYRADAPDIRQRLRQERSAGRAQADVASVTGTDIAVLANKGFLARVDTPVAGQLRPGAVHQTWLAHEIFAMAPAWNTKRVSSQDVPESYLEFFRNHRGRDIAFEVDDVEWFYGVIQVLKEEGLTRREAIDLVGRAAAQSTAVNGHTNGAQLLAAGRFKFFTSPYDYRVDMLEGKSAPISNHPAIEPMIVNSSGSAVLRSSRHPAAALLFLEYLLTDGQEVIAQQGRATTNTHYPGGPERGEELYFVDLQRFVKEFGEWSDLYQRLQRVEGKDVIED